MVAGEVLQSVLIRRPYRNPEKAENLAVRIMHELEPPGKAGYPDPKGVDLTPRFYQVELRQAWRFHSVKVLSSERDRRVEIARQVSQDANLKVGVLRDT